MEILKAMLLVLIKGEKVNERAQTKIKGEKVNERAQTNKDDENQRTEKNLQTC